VRAQQLKDVDERAQYYAIIIDASKYEEMREAGRFRLSHRAMQAALLLTLYQDEPLLSYPCRVLDSLIDIDEQFTLWRHRHALMVHRMIGNSMGTGGSSGFNYLRATAAQHRVYKDLFNISSFLMPRAELPPLPEHVRLACRYQSETTSVGGAGALVSANSCAA
jgi:tryptophan 2,3-dioxygenase